MQRDLSVYLWDLQKALGEIETFTAGKTLENYLGDRLRGRLANPDHLRTTPQAASPTMARRAQ
jgi:hypothetical protein